MSTGPDVLKIEEIAKPELVDDGVSCASAPRRCTGRRGIGCTRLRFVLGSRMPPAGIEPAHAV